MLRACSIALASVVFLLLPVTAGAVEARGSPAGRLTFEAGVGPAQRGAPFLLVGAGLGLLDDAERRLDLRGRVGVLATQEPTDPGTSEALTYNGYALIADVAHAWRLGRFEPWVSLGIGWIAAELDDPESASGPTQVDRTVGAALGAGLRLAVGPTLLFSVEGSYLPRESSGMPWLAPTPRIGGSSLLFVLTYRVTGEPYPANPRAAPLSPPAIPGEPAAEPPQQTRPAEAPPPPPPPPRRACPAEQARFPVHTARAQRCEPNPVAGGHFCTPLHVEGRFLDAESCGRACRRGAATCPAAETTGGAACARCEGGCAAEEWLACTAEGGTVEGQRCRVEAGQFGAESATSVHARCEEGGGPP